jgi:hypothetical protein
MNNSEDNTSAIAAHSKDTLDGTCAVESGEQGD